MIKNFTLLYVSLQMVLAPTISLAATAVAQPQKLDGFISSKPASIGTTSSPDASALLDMVSTTKGLALPRMSTTQRDGITSPVTGLQIFNTTTNKPNFYNGTSWSVVGSGAGAGGINYQSANPDAETDALGWTTYNNTAGTSPVNGSGGTSSTTLTRETTASGWAPIRGTGSFYLSKPASNRQGDGAAYAFSIDPADEGKRLTTTFDYAPQAGTYADADVRLFVYDVTNGTFCDVAKGQNLANHKITTGQKWTFSWDSHYNSTSYKLLMHVASTSTSSYALAFDNFNTGPQSVTTGPPSSDCTPYTPTIFGMGTGAVVQQACWRRAGDSMEINALIASGTSPTGTPYWTIPSGYTIDSSKWSTTRYEIAGSLSQDVQGTTTFPIATGGDNKIYFGIFSSSANSGTQPVTAVPASAWQSFIVKVPIAGWSSNMVLSSDSNVSAPIAARYTNTAGSSITTTIALMSFPTKDYDSASAFNGTTFTAPTDGYYRVSTLLTIVGASVSTGATAIQPAVYKNGSFYAFFPFPPGTGGPSAFGGGGFMPVKCKQGDTLQIWAGAGVNTTLYNQPGYNWVSFEKMESGSQTIGYQYSAPQVFTYTSGSGTFTVPSGAAYLRVKMVGGGGAGAGGGQSVTGGGGSGGNDTVFGSSLLRAYGGGGGSPSGAGGGSGALINAPAYGTIITGGSGGGFAATGSAGSGSAYPQGGGGGNSPLGGGGGSVVNSAGNPGTNGTGGGGAGGGGTATANYWAGGGGGAGGYIDAIVPVTSGQTFSYLVAANTGTPGNAGTGGYNGGAGGSGLIEVTVYFSNTGDTSVPQNLLVADPTVKSNGANGPTTFDEGTYVPSVSAATNSTSISVGTFNYYRIGKSLHVWGSVAVTMPTANTAGSGFTLSNPSLVTNNFTTQDQCVGWTHQNGGSQDRHGAVRTGSGRTNVDFGVNSSSYTGADTQYFEWSCRLQ